MKQNKKTVMIIGCIITICTFIKSSSHLVIIIYAALFKLRPLFLEKFSHSVRSYLAALYCLVEMNNVLIAITYNRTFWLNVKEHDSATEKRFIPGAIAIPVEGVLDEWYKLGLDTLAFNRWNECWQLYLQAAKSRIIIYTTSERP